MSYRFTPLACMFVMFTTSIANEDTLIVHIPDTHTHACTHARMHAHTHTHTHSHKHANAHAHIHTHTHTIKFINKGLHYW